MENQDHKNPTQSGHEGHGGGVHICHKCGWLFPNPHPSAKHRRAHKRVCGTVEGYRLDNTQDKTHLDGSDGEHVSDDEEKNPSDKVVGRTISRRSSSGVGSRSSRSARSEDDVFADAVTDFVDSPGPEEASYGVISRGNSLQNITENEADDTQHTVENATIDNISRSDILMEDKELSDFKAQGEKDKVEASALSQDHISSSTNSLDNGVEEGKEVASSKEILESRIPCSETTEEASEDVSALKGVSEEEPLDSVSAGGMVEPMQKQTGGFDDKVECSHDEDSPGKLHTSMQSVQVVDAANDMVEDRDSKAEANENFYVLDVLSLQENPGILVEDLDHKGGKINLSMAPDANLAVECVEFGKAHAFEESCSNTDFAERGENNYVCSVENVSKNVDFIEDTLNPELGLNKSVVEQNTVGDLDKISDVKGSNADISELGIEEVVDIQTETLEDQEVVPLENVSPEVDTVDGGDNQETTANGGTNVSEVPVGELAVTSPTLAEPAVNDVATQAKELTDDHDIGYDEKVRVEGTTLNGNETRIEEEEANKPASPETCGLTIAGYSDKNDELFELGRSPDQGKLDKNLDSGDVTAGHSQEESLHTSVCVRGIQSADDSMGEGESMNIDHRVAVRKSDDHPDSIPQMNEDVAVTDNGASITEGDRITKQHATVSAVDTLDSGSQTDSLEGNWGSVSVLSAVSDGAPATDMAASKNSPEPLAEASTLTLDPKSEGEGQHHTENTTSSEPEPEPEPEPVVALEQMARASEIQPPEGKRDEEIVAKVHNWNTGKQHTALKTLIGEAIAKSREESPSHSQGKVPVSQVDEIPVTNNGLSAKTENVAIVGPEDPKEEIGKEWNSPARYPVNIKTEKRRAKSRPYWAPFLCCSSVNAR